MSYDGRRTAEETPLFQVNDQILAPVAFPTFFGRCLYGAARVSHVDIDEDDVQQVTFDFMALPGEYSCSADNILPWTHENLLREINDGINDGGGGVDEFVLATPTPLPQTLFRWLKMAAEHRNPLYFTSIYDSFPDLPYETLGHDLLRLLWMPRHVPPVAPFGVCAGNPTAHSWAGDMEELVQAICAICGITANPEAILSAREGTLEHLAASRGDTKLLLWIVEYRLEKVRDFGKIYGGEEGEEVLLARELYYRFKRDGRWRTPLHLAVLFRQKQIICSYQAAGAASRYLPSILDFNAKDEDGHSALDLAAAIEDTTLRDAILDSLFKLQRLIYQGILDRTIAPVPSLTEFPVENARLASLEEIIDKFNLNLSHYSKECYLKSVIFAVADIGDLVKLRWLVEKAKAIDLHCYFTSNKRRISLLHAAVRRSDDVRRKMNQRRLQSDEDCESFARTKSSFLALWKGVDDITTYTTYHADQERFMCWSHEKYSICILDACGKPELAPSRIALAEWLVGKGLTLPDCGFLVHECDYAPAAYLLQYRFDIDSVISRWFSEQAPQAMLLIKEYLHGKDDASTISPQSVALMCCERVNSDPHKQTELTKLKFLQLLIRRYDVDPCSLMDADGKTILQVAVLNDYCLIALWLSANYRSLLYNRSPDGRLPIHLALADKGASENICDILCRFTGESDDGLDDRRLFALPDGEGKIVLEYMKFSKHEWMRHYARVKLWEPLKDDLVEMILDESTTVADFVKFAQSRRLERDHFERHTEWYSVLYTAIGLGRLDFLCWLDQAFLNNGHWDSLPHRLSRARDRCFRQIVLPIVCYPDLEFMVGDLLEVQCSFRKKIDDVVLQNGQHISPAIMDGTWMVENWMPIDDFPATTMLVYDLRGTSDVAGMEECQFVLSPDGIVVFFNNGHPRERWLASAISPDFVRIELTRSYSETVHPRIDRKLVMTKIKSLYTYDIPFKWRLATVQQTTATELEVEYTRGTVFAPLSNDDLDMPCREWISAESMRINRSGALKLKYDYDVRIDPAEYQGITGRALAERCGHDHIVSWIAEAEVIDCVKSTLEDQEENFAKTFLSNASNAELESIIYNSRHILEDSCISRNVAEKLEASLYVLDRCWSEQPDSVGFMRHKMQVWKHQPGIDAVSSYKPLIHAASMNLLDRLRWIMDTNRLGADSPHLRHALMNAAKKDHIDVVKMLISFGVDASGDFGQFVGPHMDNEVVEEKSLIEISFECSSGDVACFLLENDLVPETNLSDALVTECLTCTGCRVELLTMLAERGCFPINPSERRFDSTMEEFLSSLRHSSNCDEDFEALDVLCGFGGDIVSAMERQSRFDIAEFPPWIFLYIDKIKSDEKVMNELLSGTTDMADQILAEHGRDMTTLRDRCGRSLLELAAATGKVNWLEWFMNKRSDFGLVNCRGVALRDLCQQLGYTESAELLEAYHSTQSL